MRRSWWGSASRAVRTPNLENAGLRINYAAFDPDGAGPGALRVLSVLPNDFKRLSLSMSKEIDVRSALAAHELGGFLRARSHGLGLGATFTLELPIDAAGESKCLAA